MLPRSSPGAVNGRPWEITSSRGQTGGTSGHLAAAISSEVTSNGGIERIGSPNGTRRTSSPTGTRQAQGSPFEPTSSPTRRRINSPRAMPLLSVASLSASFHTDTTMSRFTNVFSFFLRFFTLSLCGNFFQFYRISCPDVYGHRFLLILNLIREMETTQLLPSRAAAFRFPPSSILVFTRFTFVH